ASAAVDEAVRVSEWVAGNILVLNGPFVAGEFPVADGWTLAKVLGDLKRHHRAPAEQGGDDALDLAVWLGGRLLATLTTEGGISVVTRFDRRERGGTQKTPGGKGVASADSSTRLLFD